MPFAFVRPIRILIGPARFLDSLPLLRISVITFIVVILSETNLKLHERFYIPNNHYYHTDRFPGRKGGTGVAVRKGITHIHIDPPPLVSVGVTGICIFTGNNGSATCSVSAVMRALLGSQALYVRQYWQVT
jgi:hypothetical protein